MPSNFVHLHAHSEYSLLDGSIKVDALVRRARELEMPAVALTDHGNLFGLVHFYRAARKQGIKPILGMEAYITRGSRHDRSRKKGEASQTDHLILLARNNEGYHNLIKLSSIAYLEGFYYKPRIDFEVLQQYSAGLIGTTACLRGTVAQAALNDGYAQACDAASRYREIFGVDNYYVEMQDHGLEQQKQLNEVYRKLSTSMKLPLIVSNDVHYLKKEDAEAHEVLLCLQTGTDLDDPRRFRFTTNELYFKTEEDMRALFPDVPEALANTVAIAERCNVELEQGVLHLPRFPLPDGFESPSHYLKHVAEEGARRRYGEINEIVGKRLAYELEVIEKMGFAGYFLIVRDIVAYARESGIPVGPGRGSAAGSLVTYAVGVTDVDPIEHGLLFERMLNPERVSMPDIDIDFCFERRDEVIRYVIDRYGSDNVCQIITFGTMAARASIRDVGRVLKIPYGDVDRIAKLIPGIPGTTLADSMDKIPELQTLVENSAEYKRLIRLSLTLEGISRHASTHAAGMIITPTPLVNHLPLYKSNKGEVTSQYDMKAVDAIGLLKIDVLGLRTLTVIDKALKMVAENSGVVMNCDNIPLGDARAFDLLRAGRTVGVFQLESEGMRELLKNLQPTVFSDIVAVNALYRPGPLGSNMHVTFVDCKHGRKSISYEHELLEPILRDTYGVILYQEQVMRIASEMAGFTLAGADLLRKAMGKKQKDVMSEQRKKFIDGARARDIARGVAERIFDQMEKFAEYGFNKSHSAAYAVVSMRTAYLKANYPGEFMAATMTSEMDDTDRIQVLLEDCRALGLRVVPPNVNTSDLEFRAKGETLFYGMAAIKNVGRGAVEAIIEERNAGGPYRSLENLVTRVGSRAVNKRVHESLVASGALDSLAGSRAQKMSSLEAVMERAARKFKDAERGQFGLFGAADAEDDMPLADVEAWPAREMLRLEKEALGFYLTGHPLDRFKNIIAMMSNLTSAGVREANSGERALVGGLVTAVKTVLDRNQRAMAFVTIEDRDGAIEAIVFSDILEKTRQFLTEDSVVLIEGKVSRRNSGEGKVMASSITPITEEHFPRSREIHLTIDLDTVGEDKVNGLKRMLAPHAGDTKMFFHLKESGKRAYVIRSKMPGVRLDYELLGSLAGSIGPENIRVITATAGV